MSCPHQMAIGAFVLGALSTTERAQVQRHLSRCRQCRETVAQLADIPDQLSRSTPPGTVTGGAESPAELLARALAATRRDIARRRSLAAGAPILVLLTGGLTFAVSGAGTTVPPDRDWPRREPGDRGQLGRQLYRAGASPRQRQPVARPNPAAARHDDAGRHVGRSSGTELTHFETELTPSVAAASQQRQQRSGGIRTRAGPPTGGARIAGLAPTDSWPWSGWRGIRHGEAALAVASDRGDGRDDRVRAERSRGPGCLRQTNPVPSGVRRAAQAAPDRHSSGLSARPACRRGESPAFRDAGRRTHCDPNRCGNALRKR